MLKRRIGRIAARSVTVFVCTWGLTAVAAPSDVIVVSKADMEFPREAVQAGAEKGKVRARLTIDGSGEVTRVEIVEANPRRVFDRAVTKSLSQWRFNNGDANRSYDIELDFKR
jgi:protein TonB